ncbi:hypothetical protein [Asanoa siamensis]|uniref:Uncharacterized protein n=1 Tax=Asanoa siamensis TaxID=926357 RepID=A0ABQ4CL26_9ACTN|nr:hypothetical protein [Asanoa siamensis]GIF72017.1 hypothetical protein Asi02nite_15350 [Asanoa siamensis]
MEIHGNQFGTIQNADRILNQGPTTSVVSALGRTDDIRRLLADLAASRTAGTVDRDVLDAAAGDLVRAVEAGEGRDARSAVERARDLLSAASGAAPLAEAAARIAAMFAGPGSVV